MPSSGSRFRKYLVAVVIFGLSVALTLGAWGHMQRMVRQSQSRQFDALVENLQQTLDQHWNRYIDVLLATRGFWEASDWVERGEWQTYIQSLRISERYPGIQGIGFAERVLPDELSNHQWRVRGEGFPGYTLYPAGAREVYFPIVYLEPFDARNQRAFGFDMYSDPVRQVAMREAALSGRPVASGRVTLVQETAVDIQPGVLVYVPVYRHGALLDTPQQRWESLEGFVYSPYRAHNLMLGILAGRQDLSQVAVEVYDSDVARSDRLLYDSAPKFDGSAARFRRSLSLNVAGRSWLVRVSARPAFALSQEARLPLIVLLGGLAVSILLGVIVWLQIRWRIVSEAAAAALAQSEARYRQKIEQSPVAIHIVDASGQTIYVNPAWETLWDATLEDLRGHNLLRDMQLMASPIGEQLRRAFSGDSSVVGPLRYEPLLSGRAGRARWIRSVMYGTRDAGGQVREVVIMQEDFTARKHADEELRKAKDAAEAANRSKDQFLALLSHELRNPLAPMLTMVDALRQGMLPTPQEIAEALDIIRRNVDLESRLIDDLLDVTRITRGKLSLDVEIVNAHTLLDYALEICRADICDKALNLHLHCDAAEHYVNADPARLQQVFWNLIKNAVKFTPSGGVITIRTANPPAPAVPPARGRSAAGPWLLIEVEDNGMGIEPAAMGRIFNAFDQADPSITRRFGGLGLGLTISKALVDAHGGTITARSEGRLRGSTFSIHLPTVPAPARLPAPADSGVLPAPLPLNILLVEDLADARRALQMILRRRGHRVSAAATLQEAVSLAQRETFDVLLSDLGLPDGSGLDLVQQLKPRCPAMVAIALSGLGMENDLQRSRSAGFEYHLTKPVHLSRLESLLRTVASQLGKS